MSTRSNISVKQENGTYATIYCHFDGYISGVGKTLLENYNELDKVLELVMLGDMSSLDYTLETSIFYCRDRGEDLCIDIDYIRPKRREDYLYVFEDGKWFCGDIELAELIKENEDEY